MRTKKRRFLFILPSAYLFFFLLIAAVVTLFFYPGSLHSFSSDEPAEQNTIKDLLPLINNGSVLLRKNQAANISINADKKFIPASVWKIATATYAFSLLGPDFRFKTEIYQTETGALFVKGYGDPFLVSEEIDLLVDELKTTFIQPIGPISIDQSFFELIDRADGAGKTFNPYDAGNFALAVNFNTLNITKTAAGSVRSAEPQTPDLPIMQAFSQRVGPGTTRINISENDALVSRYAAELISEKLTGVSPQPKTYEKIKPEKIPSGAQLIHTHYSSKTLLQVTEEMLKYSNNFIANQIFLVCGAMKYGPPGTWEKAQKAMESFLTKEAGLEKESFSVMEGSGLSRKNTVTAEGMLVILEHFQPYSNLLPEEKGIYLKSGTLNGVYSYAGYLGHQNKPSPFVIMLNQQNNYRDKILRLLNDFVSK